MRVWVGLKVMVLNFGCAAAGARAMVSVSPRTKSSLTISHAPANAAESADRCISVRADRSKPRSMVKASITTIMVMQIAASTKTAPLLLEYNQVVCGDVSRFLACTVDIACAIVGQPDFPSNPRSRFEYILTDHFPRERLRFACVSPLPRTPCPVRIVA